MNESSKPRYPEEIIPVHSRLGMKKLMQLVASILGGVAVALWLLSIVFVWIPTDVRRLGVLVDALQARKPEPQIVVFGNSVLMSGIDASFLTDRLPDEPLAWNCASNGQTFLEAFLLSQELSNNTESSIYGLSIRAGEEDEPLHPQKYNTLFMYGYRPHPRTLKTVGEIFDPQTTALLERSRLQQLFASRWAVRQFIDTQIRTILRPDLALTHSTFDLFHPQSYEERIDPSITERFLERRLEAFHQKGLLLPETTRDLAEKIAKTSGGTNRRIVFLFPPVHPVLFAARREEMLQIVGSFREEMAGATDVHIVNALDLLGAEQFIDDMHPTNEGARILTTHLAQAIDSNW